MGVARPIGTGERAVVDLGEPHQDLLLLDRAARDDVDLALEHLGEPFGVAGLGGDRLQTLERLGGVGIERARALEQHARVVAQPEPLAQDLGRRHQRRRALRLGGAGAGVVGGRDQGPGRGVRIAAARVELDEAPPGEPHQRSRGRVVDAEAQRGDRALLVARPLAGRRQPVGELGALRAGLGFVDRPAQLGDLAVAGSAAGSISRGSAAPAAGPRIPTQLDPVAGHGHRGEPQIAAVREPPPLRDQNLVERGGEQVDLEARIGGPRRVTARFPAGRPGSRRRSPTRAGGACRGCGRPRARSGGCVPCPRRRTRRAVKSAARSPASTRPETAMRPFSSVTSRRVIPPAGKVAPEARCSRRSPPTNRPADRSRPRRLRRPLRAVGPSGSDASPCGHSTSTRATTAGPSSRRSTVKSARPSTRARAIAGAVIAVSYPPTARWAAQAS